MTSHSARGLQFWEGEGIINKKVLNGPISSLVSVCAVPRGEEGSEPELLFHCPWHIVKILSKPDYTPPAAPPAP